MRSEYIPIRDISDRVLLGMNQGRRSKRFGTIDDAFRESSAYWGEHREWYVVACQHRDSDSLTRSNFRVLLKLLGGESDTVAIERANHWAVGWVEYLIIEPSNHKALRVAILAHSAASQYPILDESDWSDLEYTEAYEWAERELGEFPGWEEAFREATENTGFSDDEVGQAIEEAREKLEATAP